MNLSLLDPFRIGDIPESIEDFLVDSVGTKPNCVQFNRRGLLLASGNQNGTITIWDFDSKSISKQLTAHKQAVNSVGWTRDGKKILSCSSDCTLILWNLMDSSVETKIDFNSPLISSQLHPRNNDLCLVCPAGSPPLLVELSTKKITPVCQMPDPNEPVHSKMKSIEYNMIASFTRKGERIVVGDWRGQILFVNSKSLVVERTLKLPTAGSIKEFQFSRNGKQMLINSNDKIIRLYNLESHAFVRDYQDNVNRIQWKSCGFSNNSEYIIGGQHHKTMHTMFVWNVNGGLVKDLEGPNEGLHQVCWHPLRPVILSISASGIIYIWSIVYTARWSDFAPDFTELDENEEYVEREDEFDADFEENSNRDKKDKQLHSEKDSDPMKIDSSSGTTNKRSGNDQDDDIDIMTMEKISEFSSDEEEEIYIYPTVPERDNSSYINAANNAVNKDESVNLTIEESKQ